MGGKNVLEVRLKETAAQSLAKRIGRGLLFFLLALTILLPAGTAVAADIPNIRVCLDTGKDTVSFRIAKGIYDVIDGGTGLPIATANEGELWTVAQQGLSLKVSGGAGVLPQPYKGPIEVLPQKTGADCLLRYNNTYYLGRFMVYNRSGLMVVNVLPVDDYLLGVVGHEIVYSAPLEAMKAQALAARSYALVTHRDLYYDVTDDTNSQVYGGYEPGVDGFDTVKEAVEETAGEVICYQGKIISAYFHSNAGGYTESADNVWSESCPYLQPVPSPEDSYALRHAQSNGWPASTYQWVRTFTRSQVDAVAGVGSIKDIQVSKLNSSGGGETESGRVTELTFIGSAGEKSFLRDGIRAAFGTTKLRSTLFDVDFDSGVEVLSVGGQSREVHNGESLVCVDGDGVVSGVSPGNNDYYVVGGAGQRAVPKLFQQVTIAGSGYGHGLGLSQWGAWGMAVEQGATYDQIIKHYYTGVEIEKWY